MSDRCLGVSDWKSTIGTEEGTGETGEGSGASGEEAWGTPSSGDLSDNLPDSDHGTLSVVPVKKIVYLRKLLIIFFIQDCLFIFFNYHFI